MSQYQTIYETTGVSAANTAQTVSTHTTPSRQKRIVGVTVAYSAAPTHTGVTIVLDSVDGAGYDARLAISGSDARYIYWEPSTSLVIRAGDIIAVTAPAGGAGITSNVTILHERIEY